MQTETLCPTLPLYIYIYIYIFFYERQDKYAANVIRKIFSGREYDDAEKQAGGNGRAEDLDTVYTIAERPDGKTITWRSS